MKSLDALRFKAELNEFLSKYRKGHSDMTVWENYFVDNLTYREFAEFIRTKIGQKWLGSPEGQCYLKWQSS